MENTLIKNNKLDKTTLILKIIYMTLFILTTALLIYTAIDAKLTKDSITEGNVDLTGVGYIIVVIIFGGIGYISTAFVSLASLIINEINKDGNKRIPNRVFAILFILLPLIFEFIFILLTNIFSN